jgi:hypothetical protein
MNVLKVAGGALSFVAGAAGLGWLGFQVEGQGFDVPSDGIRDLGKAALTSTLPEPVARYAEAIAPEGLPVVETALVAGKAKLTFNGLTFPARFKFYHDAGNAYYHHIQLLWFGLPILTVHERYRDGAAELALPIGEVVNNPKVNAAALMGLWAEAIWFPTTLLTDTRTHWTATGDHSATLLVDGMAEEEIFTVRFDAESGLIRDLTSLRYKQPGDQHRTLWFNEVLSWGTFNGVHVPSVAQIRWGNDAPWAKWQVEQVLYNADVSARLAAFGDVYHD